ncbi:Uncharacterised protein [Legionella steigerwaltii]|uniref:Uncharacterized protein n=1 Tax=Legionella steigerwaltii TaxID=460 RepID=A0A378LBG3_9GAMM|nr:hypothetical protein [Legionella steigerwaltii]KTD81093.1 hypothetical protein Lstg_0320 [Legionella steigerwaltii]STY23218.1 Uncharacterised protein [Legionella steigerwaltii]
MSCSNTLSQFLAFVLFCSFSRSVDALIANKDLLNTEIKKIVDEQREKHNLPAYL